jgi:hypothetical protein
MASRAQNHGAPEHEITFIKLSPACPLGFDGRQIKASKSNNLMRVNAGRANRRTVVAPARYDMLADRQLVAGLDRPYGNFERSYKIEQIV